MHGQINSQRRAVSQARTLPSFEKSFANETAAQRLRHREIAWRDRQRKQRRSPRPKIFIRIRELERIFADRYGAVLPNDDAGLDDIFVMANHLAHLNKPDRRIAAWLQRWAPWYGDDRTAALIRAVMSKPEKWRADALAQRLNLDYATRMRLKITMVGAVDCGKAKRAALRRKRNNAAKRARRAKAGAASHATSAAKTKPWVAFGISRRTYYRRRLIGTGGTKTGTAHAKHGVVDAKQCHDDARGSRGTARATPECVATRLSGTGRFTISIPELRAMTLRRVAGIIANGAPLPHWCATGSGGGRTQ
jgi:hypothetical protein